MIYLIRSCHLIDDFGCRFLRSPQLTRRGWVGVRTESTSQRQRRHLGCVRATASKCITTPEQCSLRNPGTRRRNCGRCSGRRTHPTRSKPNQLLWLKFRASNRHSLKVNLKKNCVEKKILGFVLIFSFGPIISYGFNTKIY
jgi:hypothetical protein